MTCRQPARTEVTPTPFENCWSCIDSNGARGTAMPHPERMPYPRKFCALVAEWIARRNTKPESAEPSGPQVIADRNRFAVARHLVARAKHPPDVRGSAE